MRRFLCWLFDHDRMTTSTRHRICLRCGQRETLRQFEHVVGWEEVIPVVAVAGRARH